MHELFFLKQYSPPGLANRIKLYKKDLAFALMSPDISPSYKISHAEVTLDVWYLRIDPKVHANIERILLITPAIYIVYNATDVKTRQILPALRSYGLENLFLDGKNPEPLDSSSGISRGVRRVLQEKPNKLLALLLGKDVPPDRRKHHKLQSGRKK